MMTIYDELKARGLIAQVTNEEEIKKMINNGEAVFYIGEYAKSHQKRHKHPRAYDRELSRTSGIYDALFTSR